MNSNQIKAMWGSITDACELRQNEISAFTMSVNGGNFALGQGGDLHEPPFTLIVSVQILHVLMLAFSTRLI